MKVKLKRYGIIHDIFVSINEKNEKKKGTGDVHFL